MPIFWVYFEKRHCIFQFNLNRVRSYFFTTRAQETKKMQLPVHFIFDQNFKILNDKGKLIRRYSFFLLKKYDNKIRYTFFFSF